MKNKEWLIEVDYDSFDRDVLERSSDVPVLVDFWAPWCAPCRALGPILEKLQKEMVDRFVLAKIDSDKNPELAREYQIRTIPAVKLFVDGEVEDEFTGALPEQAIRQFLDKAIPSPLDRLAQQASISADQGAWDKAGELFSQVLEQNPHHVLGLLGMIRVLLNSQRSEEAGKYFARLPIKTAESQEGKLLRARIAFSGGQNKDSLEDLQEKVAVAPGNPAARLALGHALVRQERYAEGMDHFLEALRREKNTQDSTARKALLQVFDLLGQSHPLVAEYRPKLSSLLFS
ncbi:MAG: tetratricopeptide repeat protein [Magnetococcales bacterium]|nr:tetratricopeptide repeat protein [Magnetococcales bacterium]